MEECMQHAKRGLRMASAWTVLRTMIGAALLAASLALSAPAADAATSPPIFASEQEAQKHCPSDIVVWLNLPTGIYHFKGQRWYGATKTGAYVCKKEADKVGDRGSRNGQ
jgi:hypothetical protein